MFGMSFEPGGLETDEAHWVTLTNSVVACVDTLNAIAFPLALVEQHDDGTKHPPVLTRRKMTGNKRLRRPQKWSKKIRFCFHRQTRKHEKHLLEKLSLI